MADCLKNNIKKTERKHAKMKKVLGIIAAIVVMVAVVWLLSYVFEFIWELFWIVVFVGGIGYLYNKFK